MRRAAASRAWRTSAKTGIISSDHTQYAIIPEPFGPIRVCLGHRGVYWFDVVAHGHTAHGSMSHLGRSAIEDMGALLEAFRTGLIPELATRISALPIVPEPSRRPSLNVNAITGGQADEGTQSPCVADRCVATVDRRFIPEEPFEKVRAEIARWSSQWRTTTPDAVSPSRSAWWSTPPPRPPGRRSWPPCPARWKP